MIPSFENREALFETEYFQTPTFMYALNNSFNNFIVEGLRAFPKLARPLSVISPQLSHQI